MSFFPLRLAAVFPRLASALISNQIPIRFRRLLYIPPGGTPVPGWRRGGWAPGKQLTFWRLTLWPWRRLCRSRCRPIFTSGFCIPTCRQEPVGAKPVGVFDWSTFARTWEACLTSFSIPENGPRFRLVRLFAGTVENRIRLCCCVVLFRFPVAVATLSSPPPPPLRKEPAS